MSGLQHVNVKPRVKIVVNGKGWIFGASSASTIRGHLGASTINTEPRYNNTTSNICEMVLYDVMHIILLGLPTHRD